MRDFLAILGIISIVACLWLFLLTVRQGGIRQYDADTGQAEVLTFEGWQPAEEVDLTGSGRPRPQATVEPAPVEPTTPPTQVPPPTNAPTPSATPPPTAVPPPTETPSPAATARVLPTAGPPARQGELPAGWVQDPTGAGFYAAEPLPVSPWEVLGWLLVGLLPVGGLLAASLLAYRYTALTRAQAEAIRAAQVGAADGAAPAAEPVREEGMAGGLERETDIEAYLLHMQ
ncbi:MAG: hypothetical protein JXA37_12135 [Chloroflexia bacterium]|nr:hypothetical protein [Chloroflexia bacterium]